MHSQFNHSFIFYFAIQWKFLILINHYLCLTTATNSKYEYFLNLTNHMFGINSHCYCFNQLQDDCHCPHFYQMLIKDLLSIQSHRIIITDVFNIIGFKDL